MENLELVVPIAKDNISIEKDDKKCIECGYCRRVCNNEITVGRMYDLGVTGKPICINCGQCANMCPTEAIKEKMDYIHLKEIIKDKSKTVVVSIAPAVRAALGEEFGIEKGTNVEEKIVTALKLLGAKYVFDITFGADLTIMEEAMELVNRIKENKNLPQFTSCCPAWVKYVEIFYPELIPNLSTTKSPISMQGATIKTYFAKQKNINPQDIINVVIAPCTAKKYEIKRKEMKSSAEFNGIENIMDSDFVLTTRELAKLLKEENIPVSSLEDGEYDSPLGKGSGAGVIFGASGGVCEAALRTAYYLITNKNLSKEELDFKSIRGMDGIKEATITIDGIEVKVAVCNGMKNAKQLLDKLKNNEVYYDFIEIMNCIGGCIAGGGQPKITLLEMENTKKKRMAALYKEDEAMTLRLCHENKEIIDIYNDYFEKPNSELAEKLLHTSYQDKSYLLGGKENA